MNQFNLNQKVAQIAYPNHDILVDNGIISFIKEGQSVVLPQYNRDLIEIINLLNQLEYNYDIDTIVTPESAGHYIVTISCLPRKKRYSMAFDDKSPIGLADALTTVLWFSERPKLGEAAD